MMGKEHRAGLAVLLLGMLMMISYMVAPIRDVDVPMFIMVMGAIFFSFGGFILIID